MKSLFALLLLASAALAGCKGCKSKPPETSSTETKPPGPPSPSAPDPDWQKRRDELVRRGDPSVMKSAPVFDHSKPVPPTPTDMIKPVSKDVMMVGPIRVDLANGT